MANKTPKSKTRLQYEKEYRRVKQAILRQRKIGYDVPTELIPVAPSKLDKINKKHIQMLQEITPQYIREHSTLYETYPPKENNLNIQIIEDITSMLSEWQPEYYWTPTFLLRKTSNHRKILLLWEETLTTEGEYEIAYRLEQNASKIKQLIEKLIYDSDSKEEDDFNMGWLLSLLLNRTLTAVESDWYNETSMSMALDSLRGDNSIA